MTCTRSEKRSPAVSMIRRRLSSEIVATNAASATFWGSIVRSTCRSEPCAVKLYGIPVSRRMTKPASGGWWAKWQCTCSTPASCIRRAAWAPGQEHDAPAKNFGLPHVPRSAAATVPRYARGRRRSQYSWLARTAGESSGS